jgi:hypothetical protein
MKNNCLQNITQKQPNGLATGTQQNSRDALICSGRASSKTAVVYKKFKSDQHDGVLVFNCEPFRSI